MLSETAQRAAVRTDVLSVSGGAVTPQGNHTRSTRLRSPLAMSESPWPSVRSSRGTCVWGSGPEDQNMSLYSPLVTDGAHIPSFSHILEPSSPVSHCSL